MPHSSRDYLRRDSRSSCRGDSAVDWHSIPGFGRTYNEGEAYRDFRRGERPLPSTYTTSSSSTFPSTRDSLTIRSSSRWTDMSPTYNGTRSSSRTRSIPWRQPLTTFMPTSTSTRTRSVRSRSYETRETPLFSYGRSACIDYPRSSGRRSYSRGSELRSYRRTSNASDQATRFLPPPETAYDQPPVMRHQHEHVHHHMHHLADRPARRPQEDALFLVRDGTGQRQVERSMGRKNSRLVSAASYVVAGFG